MKNLFMSLVIALIMLTNISCVYDVIEYANEDRVEMSKSVAYASEPKLSNLNVVIINNADGIALTFDKFNIVGYDSTYVYDNVHTLNYNDTLNIKMHDIKQQTLSKILMDGSIRTETYPIYEGTITIPIKKTLNESESTIELVLYNNCPWYTEDGYNVLVEISFNITVNPWYETDTNINM